MVDLYWKCYAYGDELKPHVEFLDGIMLSQTLLPRARLSYRTQTSQSSLKEMSRGLKRVGMTPRRRHKTDFNSSMRPRMLSLAMLKTMKQLLQNLKLPKRKSRRSRKCSTWRQPMLIPRRDRTFLRRAPTLSMDSLIPSMPIWLPCPSPFLRTRRKLLQRKLQLLRTNLRSMDVLPPQSRRLKILLLT